MKHSVPQLANLPDTFASPACPTCGKYMERYSTGPSPTDPFPVPPPLPELPKFTKLADTEIPIYSGSGINPGHGKVTWSITRNAAKMDMTIHIYLGEKTGGSWSSQQSFKMIDGMLDTAQVGAEQDWWLKTPMPKYADSQIWHAIDLESLIGTAALGGMPATIEIGVKLGNAAFGLIHLLAGHAAAVRNTGPYAVVTTGDHRDDIYRTLLSLQAGMQRFENDSILQINYDALANKFLVKGSYAGLIVVTQTVASPRYAITTIYNSTAPAFGNIIYEK